MISRELVKDPKRRILTACVQMFIERGYKQTTMIDIIKEADVSAGTFQNIFHTKDGVLLELIHFMFDQQFTMARTLSSLAETPVILYAVETAIQLSIVELNEHLREIYLEAYSQPKLLELIYQKTSLELYNIFSKFNPTWEQSDFYEIEIGTSGMMRSYMARTCDQYFTLKRKTTRFLKMAFDVFHVSKKEQEEALAYISSIDMKTKAQEIMKQLFLKLEMTFDFKFSN